MSPRTKGGLSACPPPQAGSFRTGEPRLLHLPRQRSLRTLPGPRAFMQRACVCLSTCEERAGTARAKQLGVHSATSQTGHGRSGGCSGVPEGCLRAPEWKSQSGRWRPPPLSRLTLGTPNAPLQPWSSSLEKEYRCQPCKQDGPSPHGLGLSSCREAERRQGAWLHGGHPGVPWLA